MNRNDTIIAPATPPGEGGLAVIRISGPKARTALGRFFRASGKKNELESHRLYHGRLKGIDGKDIDEVIKVNPGEASLHVTKADILLKAKRLDEALENIDTSIELSSDYWPAYQKRALINEMRDDLQG